MYASLRMPGRFFINNALNSRLECVLKARILYKVRSYSTVSDKLRGDLNIIKENLNSLENDITFLATSNIKSSCQRLTLGLRDTQDPEVNSKITHINRSSDKIHTTTFNIIDNRLRYNKAKNVKITSDGNYKYGIVGVSLICVFGSLSLSLHPIFLLGSVVGLYFYRVVYNQFQLRKVTTNKLEYYIQQNKLNKSKLKLLLKILRYHLHSLEKVLKI